MQRTRYPCRQLNSRTIKSAALCYLSPVVLGKCSIISAKCACKVQEEGFEKAWNGVCRIIVNRGDWLGSPENIKGANKNAKIYVGRSTTLHNLLFCAHTLCMNYVTNTFLLASSSVRSKQLLCFVQGQGQKSEQKHTTKSIDEFHNHSPLLTMVELEMPVIKLCEVC